MTETESIGVRLPKDLLQYIEEQARRENVDRSAMIRRLMEKGIAEFRKERAAALYVEGKTSISGAAEMAGLTIPEMVQLLVSKGYGSSYSLEDFRKGVKMLQKMTKTD